MPLEHNSIELFLESGSTREMLCGSARRCGVEKLSETVIPGTWVLVQLNNSDPENSDWNLPIPLWATPFLGSLVWAVSENFLSMSLRLSQEGPFLHGP